MEKAVFIAAGSLGAFFAATYALRKWGVKFSSSRPSGYQHWVSESNDPNQRSYRDTDVTEVIRLATSQGIFGIDTDNAVAIFHDMDCQKEIFLALRDAYPSHFFHTFAVKSNPLPFVLQTAVQMGMGLEAASFGEVANGIRQVY
jgi:hypothetical protein